MRNENDFPGLVPLDDRYPTPGNLHRSPAQLNDDQFLILAAAWAEGDFDADTLSEIESAFAANPRRREQAEKLRYIRLKPGTEKWQGRDELLKETQTGTVLKRFVYVALASAAAILVFFSIAPLMRHAAPSGTPAILPSIEITSEVKEPAPLPKIRTAPDEIQKNENIIASAYPSVTVAEENSTFQRPEPIELSKNPMTSALIPHHDIAELLSMPVIQNPVQRLKDPADVNWIMRSITALSGLVTKEEKPVDGYMIAGACVRGINTVLGWDMELEKVISEDGTLSKINFSSSLLSFSSPVKNSLPQP